jgi:NAD(P)-dependent dehydrogenase (short-subunit alcohol dehydrogenase family)
MMLRPGSIEWGEKRSALEKFDYATCDFAKIVDTAVSRFGRIDVLINNAGVFIPKPFTEYTTEDFNTLVSTTLAGFLYVSQLAVKQMLRQRSGNVVNVSTTLVD